MATQSSSQHVFAEGQSSNRPPLFDGINFAYWKMRMRTFIIANDFESWKAIEVGVVLPNNDIIEWTEFEARVVQSNAKAMNLLFCALSPTEFDRVSSCASAKEVWDKLVSIYEGSTQVKSTRKNILIGELENFRMKEGENISDMFARFSKITNALKGLDREVSEVEQVMKILRALPESWNQKITAIEEAKDINTLKVTDLIGSLMSHELVISKREEPTKSRKPIALKAVEESSSDTESPVDEEDIALLTKRFKKFFRNNRGTTSKGYQKQTRDRRQPRCYRCGGIGHMQGECPTQEKNEQKIDKKEKYKEDRPKREKHFRKSRARGMYVNEEESSSNSSSDSEKQDAGNLARICCLACSSEDLAFMANDDLLSEETSQLQTMDATEVNSLTDSCASFFDSNDCNDCKQLQESFNSLFLEFEALGKRYQEKKKNETQTNDANEKLKRENEELKHKLEELRKEKETLQTALDKFSNPGETVKKFLSMTKQTDKRGLGYVASTSKEIYTPKPTWIKAKTPAFRNTVWNRDRNTRINHGQRMTNRKSYVNRNITCHFCCKKGHMKHQCKLRKLYNTSTNLIWVPKQKLSKTAWESNEMNSNRIGPKIWVPKT